MAKLNYEDKKDVIDTEINKRKSRWQLKAITWMDFDDVSQLIRIHIMEQWDKWDQSRPIEPWLNKVIHHRMTNLIRDNFWSFSRPCLRCDENQGGDLCGLYGTQCEVCPLFAKWIAKKKKVHDLKMPVSYDDERNCRVSDQTKNTQSAFIEFETSIDRIHVSMKLRLKPEHFRIYKMLFIDHMTDKEAAEILGYKENKYNQKNRYKQIENYKRKFIKEVRSIIQEEEV